MKRLESVEPAAVRASMQDMITMDEWPLKELLSFVAGFDPTLFVEVMTLKRRLDAETPRARRLEQVKRERFGA